MKKLKLIILLMLALFLVACGSATPSPSSDTTLKPGIEEVVKEEFGIIGLDKHKKEAIKVLDELTDKVVNKEVVTYEGNKLILGLETSGNYEKFKTNYGEVQKSHNKEDEIYNYNLEIYPNVHLIIDGNIIHEKHIYNNGHMYFIDDKNFIVTTPLFYNCGNIYVIGKDGGSTLKIYGSFLTPLIKLENDGTYKLASNLYLGLYVRDDNSITTDKVLITGKVSGGGTNVRFVYNDTDLKKHEYPKAKPDDYVIRAEKEVELYDNTFQMDNIQYGLSSYKLEASKNGKATEWKLKKIE